MVVWNRFLQRHKLSRPRYTYCVQIFLRAQLLMLSRKTKSSQQDAAFRTALQKRSQNPEAVKSKFVLNSICINPDDNQSWRVSCQRMSSSNYTFIQLGLSSCAEGVPVDWCRSRHKLKDKVQLELIFWRRGFTFWTDHWYACGPPPPIWDRSREPTPASSRLLKTFGPG